MSVDPAEPNVRAKNYSAPLPNYDKDKHVHVIQDQYCTICEVEVWVYRPHQKLKTLMWRNKKLQFLLIP